MNEDDWRRRSQSETGDTATDPLGGRLDRTLRRRPEVAASPQSKRVVLQAASERLRSASMQPRRRVDVSEKQPKPHRRPTAVLLPTSLGVAAALALIVWGGATWIRQIRFQGQGGAEDHLTTVDAAPVAAPVDAPSATWDEEEAAIDQRIESTREWADSRRRDWTHPSAEAEGRRWRQRIDSLTEKTALLRLQVGEDPPEAGKQPPPPADGDEHSLRRGEPDTEPIKEV